MKKIVVKLGIDVVAGVQEVNSMAVDMEKNQISVIGGIDPLYLTSNFRKFIFTELLSEEKKSQSDEEKGGEKEKKAEVGRIVSVAFCRPSQYTLVTEDNLINYYDQPTNSCTIL